MRGSILFVTVILINLFYSCWYEPAQVDQENIHFSEKDSSFYISEGTKLARHLYAGILAQLNKVLNEATPEEAVKYCNEKALPITDSLSKYYGVIAKRTSLKLRNPSNAPDSVEKKVLEMYEKTQSKNSVLIKTQDGIRFFTPIYTARICLTCHGVPNTDISYATNIVIDKLYPNDRAKNYDLYQIRGIWSITFPEKYRSNISQVNKN